MVLDEETKIQLDSLAKQDYFSDELLQEQINSSDPDIIERARFYIERRNYYKAPSTQRILSTAQQGGQKIEEVYGKTKQTLSPYAKKFVETGSQIGKIFKGSSTPRTIKPTTIKKPKISSKKTTPSKKLPIIQPKPVQKGMTLQRIGKEINVSKLTNLKNRQQIKADMNIVKPSRTNTGTFNSVLYDGVRKFNDGFHSNRFARQNMFTDKESDMTTFKQRPNKTPQGFSTSIEAKQIPRSLNLSKIGFNPVNNKFNKTKWSLKWQQ